MKKLLAIVALTVLIAVPLTANTSAQSSAEDSQIEESLRDQGVNEAPEPVEFEGVQVEEIEQTSGFVDEDGNPISKEEYDKIREDQETGLLEKPAFYIGLAVVALVGGGAFYLLKNKK